MKDYLKPEIEIISLMAQEPITDGEPGVDGDTDVESNTMFD